MRPAAAAVVGEEHVRLLAELAGVAIAAEHVAGVARNLGILLDQAAVLGEAPLDPLVEPAPVYQP